MTPHPQKRAGARTRARAKAGPSHRPAAVTVAFTPPSSGRSSTFGLPSLLGHERVAVVAGRVEGLLHRAGADPADEVQLRARLVVCAGGPGPAERLLPHH